MMPSDTGVPGGKGTGQRMTHYIIPANRIARRPECMGQGRRDDHLRRLRKGIKCSAAGPVPARLV
jgi:hypothetical protein